MLTFVNLPYLVMVHNLVLRVLTEWLLDQFFMGNRMVPFSGTGLYFIFRLIDVEVALCVTTAARRVVEFSTGELARKDVIFDSDRISKIRARLYLRLGESYNEYSGRL